MKTVKLKIIGIHCKSCKELIESELNLLGGVSKAEVNIKKNIATVVYQSNEVSVDGIIKEIENLNYEAEPIGIEVIKKSPKSASQNKFFQNVLLGGIFLLLIAILYYVISSYGGFELLAKLNETNLSFPLIFVIGLLASFHCIGMCGGIVMAYTTRFCTSVKGNKRINLSHLSYNLGRILA